MLKVIAVSISLLLVAITAGAVAVDKPLDDPALEERARNLHKQLRCLVCQNQSIEDSNAELARDLRKVVREQVAAGKSDREVVTYLVARYGDWVLLEPPVKAGTVALWAGPGFILVMAILFLTVRRRRRPQKQESAKVGLNDEEKAALATILDTTELSTPSRSEKGEL